MDFSKIYTIHWENRYNILPIKVREKIMDGLKEPFKKRGEERLRLIKEHPRLIDDSGNPTESLFINNDKYINGHLIEDGFDDYGSYSIFQPKNRIENEKWHIILEKKKKLSELVILQRNLTKQNTSYSELKATKALIDQLFCEIFNVNTKKESKKEDYPFYCKIGALFAQQYIYKKEFDYFFKKKKFISSNKLSEYIKEDILKTDKSTSQYVNDTLNGGNKSFYTSLTMMENIISYCTEKEIEVSKEFKSIYSDLKK